MAQLDVQPKKSASWWPWLLLAIIAIGLLLYFFKGCNSNHTTPVTTADTSATKTDSTPAPGASIAATEPDWNNVDFNARGSSDPDITDKDISVSGNDKYTIYTLGENILFANDKSILQGSADQKLKQITSSLNKRFKGAAIGVYGNTDSTGNPGHNKQLGAERAAAVKDWLVKNGGLDAGKVSVHSYGASKPVASNATPNGRQQNRNVKIVAFPNGAAH